MYSKILFFKGIFIDSLENARRKCKNCAGCDLSNVDGMSLNDYLDYYNKKYKRYDRIPSVYVDSKSWIKKTNLHCWNCSLSFSSEPAFVPNGSYKKVIGGEEKIVIIVYGNFCSFNCAINYLDQTKDKNIVDAGVSKMLIYKITGSKDVIAPYPSYNKLCQYCGPSGITSTDYRRHFS